MNYMRKKSTARKVSQSNPKSLTKNYSLEIYDKLKVNRELKKA